MRKSETGKQGVAGKSSRRQYMGPLVLAGEAARYGIRAPAVLPPSKRYVSPIEAGRILNIGADTIREWLYNRWLPATKLSNGFWKIRVADLEDYVRARQNLGPKRVMVIDDGGPAMQKMVAALEELGHRVAIAHNAVDAILKAVDLYPSLFIANVSLTRLDTWKLLTRIRNTPGLRSTPILIIADRDLDDTEGATALQLGMQGFLRRPFSPATLIEETKKVLTRIL